MPAIPVRTLVKSNGKSVTMPALPASKRVSAYGLLPGGQAKPITLNKGSDMAACTTVENCAKFKHNRKAVRMWIHFNNEGDILSIDFHMEPPFASLIWPGDALDAQAKKEIAALKVLVETK